jgi:hypothetical protein
VRSGKVNQTVQSHEVDTGDDQVHGSVDVVEQEQDLVNWRDPGNLEMPAARPGFVQRLVRTSFRVGQDPQNWSRAMREGWQPRPMSSVPKEDLPPTITHATLGSVIGVEGLIRCVLPDSAPSSTGIRLRCRLKPSNVTYTKKSVRDTVPSWPTDAAELKRGGEQTQKTNI